MARQRPRWRRTSILRRTLYARRFNPKRRQVELVQAICSRRLVHGEDISGDVLWSLYQKRGFLWEDWRIEAFAIACVSRAGKGERRVFEVETGASADQDPCDYRSLLHSRIVDPETAVEASFAMERVLRLPDRQREAILILADGGSPLDIASEFGIKPWDALALISEARDYLGRV
jgi:DNA-binding CsgD family transcriptional regulator